VPRSVLIVKLAAIGDVVMALPMVTALRAQDPEVRITWAVGTAAAPLLRCVDGIAETIVIDDVALLSGGRASKVQAVLGAWSALSGRRFDLAITAHSDPRYRLLAARVRATERRWLGERRIRPRLVPGRYYGDEYVRLVTEIDDSRATRVPAPHIRTTLDSQVSSTLATLGSRPLVAFAPGGARNAARENPLRRWPLESYASLARSLAADGFTVVLTGDAGDEWVRPVFRGTAAIDLVGSTTLPGLAALFARCAAVVAHDSGALHVARLAGAPVVGLFGPTLPAAVMREEPAAIAIWRGAELPCAPCYDGREFAACPSNRCLALIEPEVVAGRVRALAKH
jgi:heptosyltransferase-2